MKKKFFIAGGKLVIFAAGISAMFIIPTSFFESQHPVCIFRNIVGIECPGCGMTRAVSSIFHGDFLGAFHHNRLVVLVFPLIAFLGIEMVVRESRRLIALARMRGKEIRNVL